MAELPNDNPRIVAIETSGRIGSVALAQGPQLLVEHTFTRGLRHAIELLPALRDLCAQVQWKPEVIEQVYLSIGPGSFTGIRIAVAVARSLSLATGCRLVAVPTLDVIAENAPKSLPNLVVMLDAKRGQVFAARYQRQPDSPALIRTAEPQLIEPAEFMRSAPAGTAVLGEGVSYHLPALAGIPQVDPALWPPRASEVHKLGWAKALRGEFTRLEDLIPLYIRLPEAEEVWQRKHASP